MQKNKGPMNINNYKSKCKKLFTFFIKRFIINDIKEVHKMSLRSDLTYLLDKHKTESEEI